MEIFVNSKPLDLLPNTSVSMVYTNSFMDSDTLQGSYSYRFSIPASARNRILLGFPEIVENLSSLNTEFDCLFCDDAYVMMAKLTVWEVKGDVYSVNLASQLGAIADKLKNLKLSDLALQSIPLPAETRPCVTLGFNLTGTPPPVGSIVDFRVYRQGGTEVWHSVLWTGSISQLIEDLATKINTNSQLGLFDATKTYNKYELAKDGAGNVWECQYDGVVGFNAGEAPIFNPTATYPIRTIVNDGFDNFYKARVEGAAGSLSNGAVWQPVADPYWWQYATAATWPMQYRFGSTPKYYLYDDPADDYSIEAVVAGNQLYLYDTVGAPSLDYYLIWGQTFSTLSVAAGFQTITSPGLENNLRLVIDAMFSQALAGPWPLSNFSFPTIYNPIAFDDTTLSPGYPTRPYINYYVSGQYRYTLSGFAKQFYSPQVFVGHLLDQLFRELGVEFSPDAFESYPEFRRLLVYNDVAAVKLVRVVGGGSYLLLPFEISLKDHVPNITLGEFLNALRSFLYLGFAFDAEGRTCRLVNLGEVLANAQSRDWTLKAEAEFKIVREDPQGFKLAYTWDSADELVKDRFPDLSKYVIGEPVATVGDLPASVDDLKVLRYVQAEDGYYRPLWTSANTIVWELYSSGQVPVLIGDAKTARQPKVSPVLMERRVDEVANSDYSIAGRNVLLPSVRQPLTIRDLEIDSPYTLRLLYDWGLQQDSLGATYPMASSGIKSYAGTTLGSVALRYDGSDGIYEKLGKDWLSFLQNAKKVTRSFRLSASDLKSLRQDDKIFVDGSVYLWRTCKVTFPIRKPAELELWRVA